MKKILLFCLISSISLSGISQSFLNGIGLIGFRQTAANAPSFNAFGFIYNPRFNFLEMDNSSLSVGIPMSVALSGSATYSTSYYNNNSNNLSAMVNLPLIVNYNFGAGATRMPGQRIGFFIGAGAAYHVSTNEYVDDQGYDYSNDVSAFGPTANAGVRFGVGRRSKNIEVRVSYMKVGDNSKSNVGSVAGIFNF